MESNTGESMITSWNLMENNIDTSDTNILIEFLKTDPKLTNGNKVKEFEQKWSEWLGIKHSVLVNSGGNANYLTILIFKHLLQEQNKFHNKCEIIVSPLNWATNISSVIENGFIPVFADVNYETLSMDTDNIISKITPNTKGIFLTHLIGFNAITDKLLKICKEKNINLFEDVCESHGIEHKGKKGGTFGTISNFSFYYGHHMTTIEGGMLCTNDDYIYDLIRMHRSHGLVRECTNVEIKNNYKLSNPEPDGEFLFAYPSFNFRSTEINGVMGLNQLKRLNNKIQIRKRNLKLFVSLLNEDLYHTKYELIGNSSFALPIIVKHNNNILFQKIISLFKEKNISYRLGMAGGGNHLRQPYLKNIITENPKNYPITDYIHYNGLYIGNYHGVTEQMVIYVCKLLNELGEV